MLLRINSLSGAKPIKHCANYAQLHKTLCIAKQEVIIRSGHTLQAQLLAAGEVDLHPWSHAQRPLLMAARGAPVGIAFLQPVVSKAQGLLLSRRSPHPHAASLFIDWALSEE